MYDEDGIYHIDRTQFNAYRRVDVARIVDMTDYETGMKVTGLNKDEYESCHTNYTKWEKQYGPFIPNWRDFRFSLEYC
jgi:hypothetical protein